MAGPGDRSVGRFRPGLPSTSVAILGTEKWSAGPTIVVLKQTGRMTYGALWNQVWSSSGNTERADVNQPGNDTWRPMEPTRSEGERSMRPDRVRQGILAVVALLTIPCSALAQTTAY